jgi:hypothetical protein
LAQAVQAVHLVQTAALMESIQYFLQLHQQVVAAVLINLDRPMTADQVEEQVMPDLQQVQATHLRLHHLKAIMVVSVHRLLRHLLAVVVEVEPQPQEMRHL